jgi:hypothetical protein
MKDKKIGFLLVAVVILAGSINAQQSALAVSSSICNSVACDNPQPTSIFEHVQDVPLNRPASVNVCEVLNNWKVDAVIQVIGGLLKVNWVYTLIPGVVCHLVG